MKQSQPRERQASAHRRSVTASEPPVGPLTDHLWRGGGAPRREVGGGGYKPGGAAQVCAPRTAVGERAETLDKDQVPILAFRDECR